MARDPETGRFISDGAPKGWTPSVEIGLNDAAAVLNGEFTTEVDALRELGLAPEEWEVTGFRRKRWEVREGEFRSATAISVRRRASLRYISAEDLDKLHKDIREWAPPSPPAKSAGKGVAFAVCLSDWQVGKGENGGTSGSIDRILSTTAGMRDRVLELRAQGRTIDRIVLFGLGDLLEGCTGFYPSQPFTTDLDNRQQMLTVVRLIVAVVREAASLAPRVDVVSVAGNHGEIRQGGRAITGPGDNLDLLAFDLVKEILAGRKEYSHVRFTIPDDALSVCVDVAGVKVGAHHGHMMSGGVNASAKAQKWWSGQTFGLGPVRDAKILLTGHFHAFQCQEFSAEGRTWFQAPAMDGGSQWFTESSGLSSPPGMLTMLIGEGCGPRGWSDLQIL